MIFHRGIGAIFLCAISKQPEVGTCVAIIAVQACGATISLVIALAPQLFLNGCGDTCAASILAILSAIAQAQVKISNTIMNDCFSIKCDLS